MATIALYANKINRMPGMINDVKRTVSDYKTELSALKTRALTINSSVCNLDDVISSIQTSTQTQEQKTASLDTFAQNSEQFISDVVRIDGNVADVVKQRKDDFYDKYNYLKPECEKGGWEKFCNGLASVGEWCKAHWKLIVMAILAIAVIVVIVLFPAVAPLMLLIAKGALLCAAICGIAEGASSALTGGSFWEGFENGAFTGAIAAIILSGIAIVFTGVMAGVSLVLDKTLLSGALSVSGGGLSVIAELGGIFNNITDISWGKMLQDMAFSAAFAEVFYNLSKAEGTADNVTDRTDIGAADIGSVAGRYGNGKCDKAAEAVKTMLTSNNEHGEIITLSWVPNTGYIWSDIRNMSVGDNGFHMGVLYNGMVYCNIHPYGLEESGWINDFNTIGVKSVTKVPF